MAYHYGAISAPESLHADQISLCRELVHTFHLFITSTIVEPCARLFRSCTQNDLEPPVLLSADSIDTSARLDELPPLHATLTQCQRLTRKELKAVPSIYSPKCNY